MKIFKWKNSIFFLSDYNPGVLQEKWSKKNFSISLYYKVYTINFVVQSFWSTSIKKSSGCENCLFGLLRNDKISIYEWKLILILYKK